MTWPEFRELILAHPHLVSVTSTRRGTYSACPPSVRCTNCPFGKVVHSDTNCLLNPERNVLTRFIPTRLRKSNPELFI